MTMKKLTVTRELKSKSASIIWRLMSTPEGMTGWLADSVTRDGDTLTFAWGHEWSHHEKRQAMVQEEQKGARFRFAWTDEEGEGTFVEMALERSTITGEFIMNVTDFAQDEDMEWLEETWEHNFKRLRRKSGI